MPQEPVKTASTVEQRLQLLIEAVVDYGIFLLDTEGHVVSWNTGAQRLKGWRREEILGRHFSTFYPPEAIATGWPQEELRRAVRDGRFEDEGWRLRKDGTRFWANVVITALRDPGTGELTGFAKVTRDLTERRAQEEALRASEERLRLMLDSIGDHAIFMLDAKGCVQSWNRGAEAINGYSGPEIMGRHFRVFFSPEDRAASKPERELHLARTEGRFEDEGWRVRKDGSRFWGKVVVTPIYSRDGSLMGYAKVTQDLSMHRRLHELEQSTRRMNQFLAMLAHELRNPLAPIRNAVTIMQLDKDLPASTRRYRDIIDRQLTQLTRLVDDLLDVSRLTTGKIKLRRERTDMAAVLSQSIETARPLIEARGHELVTHIAPAGELMVDGDPTRLTQVAQNLLVNAAKYTPDHGRIEVTAARQDGFVEVVVRDNGRGLEATELDRIFELFEQGEAGLSSPTDGGLGVGLALARALVQMHGGAMTAASPGPGQGATFSFRVPAAGAAAASPARKAA